MRFKGSTQRSKRFFKYLVWYSGGTETVGSKPGKAGYKIVYQDAIMVDFSTMSSAVLYVYRYCMSKIQQIVVGIRINDLDQKCK
jgi:hypothetical protein